MKIKTKDLFMAGFVVYLLMSFLFIATSTGKVDIILGLMFLTGAMVAYVESKILDEREKRK